MAMTQEQAAAERAYAASMLAAGKVTLAEAAELGAQVSRQSGPDQEDEITRRARQLADLISRGEVTPRRPAS